MADGTPKPIEDLANGDKILATDPEQENDVVRRTDMRRSRVSAVLVLSLSAVTGCTVTGNSASGSSGSGLKTRAESSPTPASGGSLTRVAGYAVKEPSAEERVEQRAVKTDDACEPLAYAMSGAAVGKPESAEVRQAVGGGTATTVALAVYEGEHAQEAMAALSDAADDCAKGFPLSVGREEQRVTKVVRELAPQGTDQAMAFEVTAEQGVVKVVVFRKGGTVGYFSTVSTAAAGVGKAFTVPAAVIEAQLLNIA